MNPIRMIALIVLLGGLGCLAYAAWQYFDSRREIHIGDTRLVIEDAGIPPAAWVGGALVTGGGIALAAAGNNKG